MIELQRRVYPDIPAFRREHLESHLRVFPQGQFVVEAGDRLIGSASSLVVLWDDYGLHHSWNEEQIVVADLDLHLLDENRLKGTTIPLLDKRTDFYSLTAPMIVDVRGAVEKSQALEAASTPI